jgi:hypothetical protein
MTEQEKKRDLFFGAMVVVYLVVVIVGWRHVHLLNTARAELEAMTADRDAWKRTASVLEDMWLETKGRAEGWEKQSNELPPHGTAKPDRGE